MMRKTNLFAVLTAVVALTFTACTNIEDVAMPEQKVLDFLFLPTRTHVQLKRAARSRLMGKHSESGVFYFETVDTDVFLNQEVKYNGTTSVWEYSPLKYWDTRSSYEFYAYYPYKASGVTIDDNKNITVTDFTVEP